MSGLSGVRRVFVVVWPACLVCMPDFHFLVCVALWPCARGAWCIRCVCCSLCPVGIAPSALGVSSVLAVHCARVALCPVCPMCLVFLVPWLPCARSPRCARCVWCSLCLCGDVPGVSGVPGAFWCLLRPCLVRLAHLLCPAPRRDGRADTAGWPGAPGTPGTSGTRTTEPTHINTCALHTECEGTVLDSPYFIIPCQVDGSTPETEQEQVWNTLRDTDSCSSSVCGVEPSTWQGMIKYGGSYIVPSHSVCNAHVLTL